MLLECPATRPAQLRPGARALADEALVWRAAGRRERRTSAPGQSARWAANGRRENTCVGKRGDLGRCQTGFCEHLVGVLAWQRCGPTHRRRSGGEPGRRRDDLVSSGWMLSLWEHVDHLIKDGGRGPRDTGLSTERQPLCCFVSR